ncbi:MAG TPA: hypothetical protein VKE92_07555, partial [Anaerolineales bacterium]|nr:hypothetical protein [Anaerolineales bacterium]
VPVFLGGMLRSFMEKRASSPEEVDERREQGVLFGSGLVGGEGLMGVGIAAAAFYQGAAPAGFGDQWAGAAAPLVGLAAFVVLAFFFARSCLRRPM